MDRIEQTSLGFLLLDAARAAAPAVRAESRDIPMTSAQLQIVVRLKRPRRHDPGALAGAARHRADDAEPPPRPHGGRRPRRAPRRPERPPRPPPLHHRQGPGADRADARPRRWPSTTRRRPAFRPSSAPRWSRPRHHHRQPLRGRRGAEPNPTPQPQEPDHERRSQKPTPRLVTGAEQRRAAAAAASRRRGRRRLLIVALPLALALGGGYVWMTGGRYIETEDAYVQQNRVTWCRRSAARSPPSSVARERDRRRRPDAVHASTTPPTATPSRRRRPASPRPGSRSSA